MIDVSILQVCGGNDQRWKDYDLLVDGKPVDIKNARHSLNSPDKYVEYCVPQFKIQRQTKANVIVVGVLSDYKKRDSRPSCDIASVILGEVGIDEINRLKNWTQRRFGTLIDFQGLWRANYQPGWAFEYPPEQYRERLEAIDEIDDVLRTPGALDPGFLRRLRWLFALRKDRGLVDTAPISEASRSLLNDLHDLKEECGLSRRSLFVFTIGAIIEAISRGDDPNQIIPPLRDAIFFPVETFDNTFRFPLGLSDPQEYVGSLINVFPIVFEEIRRRRIHFVGFKLTHPNILKGKVTADTWLTLFAYCGGKQEMARAKCGRSPLVLGLHATCPVCQHLICDKCNFCTSNCTAYLERKVRNDDNGEGPTVF